MQYSGILAEHRAVRTAAGLFDVSHMGQLEVHGPDAGAALAALLSRTPQHLAVGQAQYALLLNEGGGSVDDVMVYRLEAERFLLIVNAANEPGDWEHLQAHLPAAANATAINASAEYGLLALQGPAAEQVLQWLCDSDLSRLAPRHVLPSASVAGEPTAVARTGYTGEAGFELLAAVDGLGAIWDGLLDAGRPTGLHLVGLGARDTLRLEASLPLYGHELNAQTSPLDAALGWAVDKRADFVGAAAVQARRDAGGAQSLRMLQLDGRAVARAGDPVHRQGNAIGTVTSGSFSPTWGQPLAMAYIARGAAGVGDTVEVQVRGRPQPATVVKRPFYRRTTDNEGIERV